MRLFLLKVGSFFGVLFVCLFGFRSLAPYYYANPDIVAKFGYLRENTSFDLLFLGSSRVYRHVDPDIIDEIMGESNTSSFNLGAGGTYGLEVLHLAENILLKDDFTKLRYLVVELQLPEVIDDQNLHAARSKYYLDTSRCNQALDFLHAYYPDQANALSKNFRIAWLERSLSIGMIRAQAYSLFVPVQGRKKIGPANNGYVNLDVALGQAGGGGFHQRRQAFLSRLDSFERDIQDHVQSFSDIQPHSAGMAYLKAHLDLIELGRERGVHVVFHLSPIMRGRSQSGTEWMRRRLPYEHIVDMSNPQEYPEFYDSSLYFDHGHFNAEGATRYSYAFAEALKVILRLD